MLHCVLGQIAAIGALKAILSKTAASLVIEDEY
jgi:hypothetical protein